MGGIGVPAGAGRDPQTEEIERLYRALRPLLIGTLIRRFEIPPPEAETLLHDVFVSFISVKKEVADPRAWLVAASCNAARAWRRSRARYDAASILDSEPVADDRKSILDTLFFRDALTRLPERTHEAVRLRFYEQLTYPEISARLGMSIKSVEKLVAKTVVRLRNEYVAAKK